CQPSESAVKLAADNAFGASLLSLFQAFAHAKYHRKVGCQPRVTLLVNHRIALRVERATLGMTDNNVARARVAEHRRGNFASMRALLEFRRTVLSGNADV